MLELVSIILQTVGQTLSSELTQEAFRRFKKSSEKEAGQESRTFPFLRDFYAAHRRLAEGMPVTLGGTMSVYGPFLPGEPAAKRDLHLKIRRHMPRIQKMLEKRRHAVTSTTLDALIAFSAGQMVLRKQLDPTRDDHYYCGLYESIVRNGVPLFVEARYFEDQVRPRLMEGEAGAFAARVTGRVDYFAGYWEQILERIGLDGAFDLEDELASLRTPVGLRIQGPEDGTGVEILGPAPYLDGDIWIAADTPVGERVASRFLDLASAADLDAARQGLRKDSLRLFPGCPVLAQFDEYRPLFPERVPAPPDPA